MQVIWNGETTAAIYIGLHAAWDIYGGFRRIELESDSKAAIQLIQSNSNGEPGIAHLVISSIQILLQRPWQARVTHVYREANRCAD